MMEKTEQSGKVPASKVYDVQFLPVKGKKLTPKKARKWRQRIQDYQLAAEDMLLEAEEFEDKWAAVQLSRAARSLVHACDDAIEDGKPVEVTSWLDVPTDEGCADSVEGVIRLLALVARMEFDNRGARIAKDLGQSLLDYLSAADAARRQAHPYKSPVAQQEEHADRVVAFEAEAARVLSEAESLEATIRTKMQDIIDTAMSPHWSLANALRHHSRVIFHEHLDGDDPGKPPLGYAEWRTKHEAGLR